MTRETFMSLLGLLPDISPPNTIVIEEEDCGSYLRQTIEYDVESGERIRAYLCIPHSAANDLPAVYCFHQHGGNYLLGKSEVVGLSGDSNQAYAKELAERGYLTLAPDAICFEDRCEDKKSPDFYHIHQLHIRLIRGQTLLGKMLHDISVGINILHDLPKVDSNRIGFIGHSYGGRAALFAPVFDPRIKTGVCSCGSTNYRDMPAIQADFVVPGILNCGDIEDIVRLIEPSNILILGKDQDKWSIGVMEMIEYAQSAFQNGILEGHEYSGGHQFTAEMREHAYDFLAKHL